MIKVVRRCSSKNLWCGNVNMEGCEAREWRGSGGGYRRWFLWRW